jgi:hypothetical protein
MPAAIAQKIQSCICCIRAGLIFLAAQTHCRRPFGPSGRKTSRSNPLPFDWHRGVICHHVTKGQRLWLRGNANGN